MFFAFWSIADIGLDVNQSITYFRHAFDNGTFKQWSVRYQNSTGPDYHESLSPGYFITSMVAWGLMPSLMWIGFLGLGKKTIALRLCCNGIVCNPKDPGSWLVSSGSSWNVCNLFVVILFLPLDISLLVVAVYVVTPLTAVVIARRIAKRNPYEFDEDIFGGIDLSLISFEGMKLGETLWEALPQLILAIVFTSNNAVLT